MSFRDQVTEEVRAAAENTTNDSDEPEEVQQIEIDMGTIPFVKFYPTTLVSGVLPKGEGNPIIRFPDRGNNDGRQDQGYLGIVMDDLEILTDADEGMSEATFVETDADDSTEFRAVNFDDDKTSKKFGGEAVSIDGDQYGVEDTTTSIDGRAILIVDRTASTSVARKLDVNGGTLAGMDETTGDVNGGLIEYAFTGDNGENVDIDGNEVPVGSRYARNPELRDGLYGERVGFMVTRRSEADAGATGFTGGSGEPVVGEGDDGATHNDPGRATYEELVAAGDRRDMMWYSAFDMASGESLEMVTDDDPEGREPTGYSFLEWSFDPSAGNLPDKDWEFVQQYIDSGMPDDEDTIRSNVEDNLDDLSDDPNVERMVGLIQAEAGQ